MRRQDPRLERPVTVSGYRLYVGELLDRWSRETGVSATASDRDGAASDRLSLSLQHIPLADAMNAVRSLFSYQDGLYQWERDKDPQHPSLWTYRLVRTPLARAFPQSIRQGIDRDFSHEIQDKIAAAREPAQDGGDAGGADPSAEESHRDRAAMRALGSLLTPEQLSDIMEGRQDVRIPESQFGDSGAAFIASEQAVFQRHNPRLSWPAPTALIVKKHYVDGEIAPDLTVYVEQTYQGAGGTPLTMASGNGWAGGYPLERTWQSRLTDLWRIVPEERSVPGFAGTPLAPLPQQGRHAGGTGPGGGSVLYERLLTLSRRAKVSFVARVPAMFRSDPGPPSETINAYTDRLRKAGLDTKWSCGIFAITSHAWIRDEPEERRIPWTLIRRFRATAAGNPRHVLSFDDLCAAAAELSQAQLQQLCDPAQWQMDRWDNMRDVLEWQPALSSLARNGLLPAAKSTDGAPLSALSQEARNLLVDRPQPGDRLRIVIEDTLVTMRVESGSGQVRSTHSFVLQPWPLPDGAETAVR